MIGSRRWPSAGLWLMLVALTLSACATGPRLAEVQAQFPPIPAGKGRVWFYRSGIPLGMAVQPAVMANGSRVGDSVPNGFFYADLPAGPVVVTTATETDYSVSFVLDAGQERYVRTVIMPGIIVGRVYPELVDPDEARADLASKSYTGGMARGL